MKKLLIIPAAMLACLVPLSVVHADEDLFDVHNAHVKQKLEYQKGMAYQNAKARNLAKRAKDGTLKKGDVVIDGEGVYADGQVVADGAGNVSVAKGARIRNLVNKVELKNSDIIIQKKRTRH